MSRDIETSAVALYSHVRRIWGGDSRSHKRYFYRNSTTGDAQWTYPEADVIGGTEEMELCTTPPPQGQEEPCIIGTSHFIYFNYNNNVS